MFWDVPDNLARLVRAETSDHSSVNQRDQKRMSRILKNHIHSQNFVERGRTCISRAHRSIKCEPLGGGGGFLGQRKSSN